MVFVGLFGVVLISLGLLMVVDPIKFAALFYWVAGKPKFRDLPTQWRFGEIWCDPAVIRESSGLQRRVRIIGVGLVIWGAFFLLMVAARASTNF